MEHNPQTLTPTAQAASPAPPTKVSSPIFDMDMQMTIAHKRPEEMTAEERLAYDRWQAYDAARRQHENDARRHRHEERQREAAAREEGNRKAQEYMQRITTADEHEGTLEWFIQQVRRVRAPEPSLHLRCSTEEAQPYLLAAYEAEVLRRSMELQNDTYTQATIATVARWLCTHSKPGLMLRGYIGVGKTTMLWAIKSILQHLLNVNMPIVDARKISDLGKGASSEYSHLKGCDALGIDDLGTEPLVVKNYGNEVSPIVELLTERYNARKFTIITTNLTIRAGENGTPVDELQQIYGDRLYDRIKEMFNIMAYDGTQPSYRK